jgi:antitoxin component of RelBE/YafQ-DinJ toxin-antitoxin module
MAREKVIRFRVLASEHEAATSIAKSMGVSVSEILRDYVKELIKRGKDAN